LKLVMRTANWEEKGALEPPRAFSSVSKDGGRTWSPAQQEPDLWNARSKGFYGRSANGTHIYVYNDGPPCPRRARGPRCATSSSRSPAARGARSKRSSIPARTTPIHAHRNRPGDFRAVWDSGTKEKTRTHIRFGKLRLPAGTP